MNIEMIQASHEELENVVGGLRTLGHLVQISANSAESIDLDGLGKLLISLSTTTASHYDGIHLGLYDKPSHHR